MFPEPAEKCAAGHAEEPGGFAFVTSSFSKRIEQSLAFVSVKFAIECIWGWDVRTWAIDQRLSQCGNGIILPGWLAECRHGDALGAGGCE